MSTSFRSLVRTLSIVLAILFTLVAAGQYLYLRHQLRQATRGELWDGAESVREAIAFRDKWDLEGYRRTTEVVAGTYFIVTPAGTLIDIIGHPEDLLGRVSLPFHFDYGRSFRAISDVGEDWVMYVHKLTDGMAVLGVRVTVLPEDLERRFKSGAALFGNTIAEASRVPERKIDEALDYGVIDANGIVRSAVGGIPFETTPPQIPNSPIFSPARQVGDRLYAALIDPIVSRTGRPVGMIATFEEVTDSTRLLHQSAVFNGLVAAILWLTTVALVAVYLRHIRPSEIPASQTVA